MLRQEREAIGARGMGPSGYRGPRGAYRGPATPQRAQGRYEQGQAWMQAYLGNAHSASEARAMLERAEQEAPDDVEFFRGARTCLSRSGVVGAIRSRQEIIADPLATADEIASLVKENPLDALNHPNIDAEGWWDLAAFYPIEAMASPLFGMMILEAPERWGFMEVEKIPEWIGYYLERAPESVQRLFAADCAEHVLPLVESERLREECEAAIVMARHLGTHGTPLTARERSRWVERSHRWEGEHVHWEWAAIETPEQDFENMVYYVGMSAYSAVLAMSAKTSATQAREAVYHHAHAQEEVEDIDEETGLAIAEEEEWQWRRLVGYVKEVQAQEATVGSREIKISKERLQEVLAQTNGRRQEAARLLGCSLTKVTELIREYGLGLSPEERQERLRTAHAARTPEQRAARATNIANAKLAKFQSLRDEEKAARTQQKVDSALLQRVKMSTEQKEAKAQRLRDYWANLPEAQKIAHAEKQKELKRAYWENPSDEQRDRYSKGQLRRWDNTSDEVRQETIQHLEAEARRYWDTATEAQKAERSRKISERAYDRWEELPEEVRAEIRVASKERWDAMTRDQQIRALMAMQREEKAKGKKPFKGTVGARIPSVQEIETALQDVNGNLPDAARVLRMPLISLKRRLQALRIETERYPQEKEEIYERGENYSQEKIEAALRATRGNQGLAARQLGTSPINVLRLIRRYQINVAEYLTWPPSQLAPLPSLVLPSESKAVSRWEQKFNEARARQIRPKSRSEEVGRLSPSAESEVTAAIDRAYGWWFKEQVGAKQPPRPLSPKEQYQRRGIPHPYGSTSAEKEERRRYLQSLSRIKEPARDSTLADLGVLQGWYDSASLQRECRRLFGHGPGFYNFVKVAEHATPNEWAYWTGWYHNAKRDVEALAFKYSLPLDLVAALVAVTSPGNMWHINLAVVDYILAGTALQGHPRGSWKGTSTYPANGRKVEQIIEQASSDPVNGPKVTAFYLQLVDPEANQNFATIDGHMINLWLGLDQGVSFAPGLTRMDHAEIRSDLDAAAKHFGVKTQELQALCWYVWRYSLSKEPIPSGILAATQRLVRSRLHEKAEDLLARKRHQRSSLQQFLSEHPQGAYPDVEAMLAELDDEISAINL